MTFSILSRKIVNCFLFLCLSPPGDQWCDVLVFVPAESQVPQHFRSSQMHDTCDACSLHIPIYLLGHIPDSSMSRTAYPQKSLKADVDLRQLKHITTSTATVGLTHTTGLFVVCPQAVGVHSTHQVIQCNDFIFI